MVSLNQLYVYSYLVDPLDLLSQLNKQKKTAQAPVNSVGLFDIKACVP